ncbi:hypothetical protein BD769DRAFT_1369619 [Suillus cothurnatus]|nr:hypothetical protein BD769DRAFT_1369619 [Suillus cothurnatus]
MGEKRRSIPRENRPHEEGHSGPEKRQPVPRAHMDQTPAASVARVRDANPHETDVNPHKVPSLLRKRFQIINLWRPISHAAVDRPLALCDFRSVDFDKAVALTYPDREGESEYNPNH